MGIFLEALDFCLKSTGPITILSCGHTLQDDIEKYGIKGDIGLINDVIGVYPMYARHVFSCETQCLNAWLKLRFLRFSSKSLLYAHAPIDSYTTGKIKFKKWKALQSPCGSTMFAALCCIELGYTDIRILGAPEDTGGHFYDFIKTGRKPLYLDKWHERINHFKGFVTCNKGELSKIIGEIDNG